MRLSTTSLTATLRRHAARLVALAIAGLLYPLARLPEASQEARRTLAGRFALTKLPLYESPTQPKRASRQVHPSLRHVEGWISTVGAAVALGDLDANGLSDDACLVDPRTDEVIVLPVPVGPARYTPILLAPEPLAYDPATMAPMGSVLGDFDEDGHLDVLVYYWGRTPIAFLRRGDRFVPREVWPAAERWYTNAATLADLDGDGHLDLVLGNYFSDGARVLDEHAAGRETLHESMSYAANGGSKRFLLGAAASGASSGEAGLPLFRDAGPVLEGELATSWTLAVAAADLDGDQRPEVYLANDFGPDRLLHNRSSPGLLHFVPVEGRRTLTSPKSCVLGHDSFKGMGADFGDLDGDGRLDLYVSNITVEFGLQECQLAFLSEADPALFRDGVAPYVNRAEALGLSRSGWAWEARIADLDDDGQLECLQATGFLAGRTNRWPELHEIAMGNDGLLRHPGAWHRFGAGDRLSGDEPNALFVRGEDGRFVDVAREVGFGEPMTTRGIATADVDGDGDLDLAVANQWQPSFFYRNDRRDAHTSLVLDLRLPLGPGAEAPTRPAVGAAARVTLAGGRLLVGQVDGGNGHSGVRSPELHFGLGSAGPDTRVVVDVRWRDARGEPQGRSFDLTPGRHRLVLR